MIILTSIFGFVFTSSNINLLNGSHCSATPQSINGNRSRNSIAMIDSLSKEIPDPSFVESVSRQASLAGFAFDYYEAKSVTVNFILNLPRLNYTVVILRMHSGPEALITSEPYSQQNYVIDQLRDRIWADKVNQTVYFGISSSAVSTLMCGRFEQTTFLAMGCDTMKTTELPDAFLQMGARAFIGWDGMTTAAHSDTTFSLVIEMLLEHQTMASTVAAAMHQVGPDPTYGSQLQFYPTYRGQSRL